MFGFSNFTSGCVPRPMLIKIVDFTLSITYRCVITNKTIDRHNIYILYYTLKVNFGFFIMYLFIFILLYIGRISSDRQILLKEIAASALMIFFDKDLILLMVGGSWQIT
jgi:hypothetical protein